MGRSKLPNKFVGETKIKLGNTHFLLRPTNAALARWEGETGKSILGLAVKMTNISAKYGRSMALDLIRVKDMAQFFVECANAGGHDTDMKEMLELIQEEGLASASAIYMEAVMRTVAPPGIKEEDDKDDEKESSTEGK